MVKWWKQLVVCTAALCLMEVALQFFKPEYRHHCFTSRLTGSYPIELNELGYRGPIPSSLGPERPVLAVGDSVTFASGQPVEASWPNVLAGQIAAKDVLNGGFPGVGVASINRRYLRDWQEMSPSVIVLCVTPQLVSRTYLESQDAGRISTAMKNPFTAKRTVGVIGRSKDLLKVFLQTKLCLPSFASVNCQRALFWLGLAHHDVDPKNPLGPLPAYGWRQPSLSSELTPAMWEELATQLKQLKSVVERANAELVLTFVPPRFVISDSISDNEKLVPKRLLAFDAANEFRNVASRLRLRHCDLTSVLQAKRASADDRDFYINFDFTHLNADGATELSRLIASELFPDESL